MSKAVAIPLSARMEFRDQGDRKVNFKPAQRCDHEHLDITDEGLLCEDCGQVWKFMDSLARAPIEPLEAFWSCPNLKCQWFNIELKPSTCIGCGTSLTKKGLKREATQHSI